jgi:RimJ/RimL family protein N-acetyltransferase
MITGKNVVLRAIEKADLPQLMEWRNNPEMRKYFRGVDEINTDNQNKWFDVINDKDSIHKMFAIVKKDTNELMGACGLCHINWINRSADFSIYIGYDNIYVDNVYAVEAANLMRDYGFEVLNLHRLWTEIYSLDKSKKKLYDLLEFKLEGEFRDTYWHGNMWHSSLFYALLSSDERS